MYAGVVGLTEVVLDSFLVNVLWRLIAAAHHVNEVQSVVQDQWICARQVTL